MALEREAGPRLVLLLRVDEGLERLVDVVVAVGFRLVRVGRRRREPAKVGPLVDVGAGPRVVVRGRGLVEQVGDAARHGVSSCGCCRGTERDAPAAVLEPGLRLAAESCPALLDLLDRVARVVEGPLDALDVGRKVEYGGRRADRVGRALVQVPAAEGSEC